MSYNTSYLSKKWRLKRLFEVKSVSRPLEVDGHGRHERCLGPAGLACFAVTAFLSMFLSGCLNTGTAGSSKIPFDANGDGFLSDAETARAQAYIRQEMEKIE